MLQITHLITGLFSITDVQEYIHSTRMDKPGAWGAEVKIMTLSHLLNTPILVYMQELGMWTVSTPDLIDSTRRGYASKKSFYLNRPHNHYAVIVSFDFQCNHFKNSMG